MTDGPRTASERNRRHATSNRPPPFVHGTTRTSRGPRWSVVLLGLLLVVIGGAAAVVAIGTFDDDPGSEPPRLDVFDAPVELHAGPVGEEITLQPSVGQQHGSIDGLVLNVSASGGDGAAVTLTTGCGGAGSSERLASAVRGTSAVQLVVGLDGGAPICLQGEGAVVATVDAIATITGATLVEPGVRRLTDDLVDQWGAGPMEPGGAPDASAAVVVPGERLVVADSRLGATTFDGEYAGTGLRPAASTWQVPVVRGGDERPTAAVVEVSAEAVEPGDLWVQSPAGARDVTAAPTLTLDPTDGPDTGLAVVALDPMGRLCVTTSTRTHVAVTVVAWIVETAEAASAVATSAEACPAQELFPHWLMVAMYGTDRSARLGVLGEQDPDAAAARLEEVAARWRRGDRPVLPAFELIATLATSDPGRDGQHRLVSDPAFVQRYLDAARRHGFYLVLDIQPGYADFLDEAKRYEEFLRQPDVGLALDAEWRTTPPNPPGGGHIGTVDAAEVNAVAEWLAKLVAEEELPEKLLVLHQFRPQMITNREAIVEPDGVAIVVHMDGFGTRAQKQHTWDQVRVGPPWDNGLKLFYDEDVEIYQPSEVLAGAFDPMPVLITYQ